MPHIRLVPLIGLLLVLLAACGGASADTQAITAATNAYMQQQANITPIKVDVEKVSGDFARTRATPPESLMTDPATVFLKRTNGQWQGIIYGTAFDQETYNQFQIPRDLWVGQ